MRVGDVVTDRGGGRRPDGVVSGEVVGYRACGVCIDALDGGGEVVVGDAGEDGPGKGEECNRVTLVDPGFALRNLSISACNCAHSCCFSLYCCFCLRASASRTVC